MALTLPPTRRGPAPSDGDQPATTEWDTREGGSAVRQTISTHDVADGMTIRGIFGSQDYGAQDSHVFAVGSAGRHVLVVHMGQLGLRDHFPVPEFTTMALAAMGQGR